LVTINIGRYGIYIKHGAKNYSMKSKAINDLDDAIELIQEIDAERASRDIQRFTHENEELNVLNGRYGPYISYMKKNYKIPKDKDPKALTLDDCLTIISEAPKKKKQAKKK
jgi:DNA topoisomerase-1